MLQTFQYVLKHYGIDVSLKYAAKQQYKQQTLGNGKNPNILLSEGCKRPN